MFGCFWQKLTRPIGRVWKEEVWLKAGKSPPLVLEQGSGAATPGPSGRGRGCGCCCWRSDRGEGVEGGDRVPGSISCLLGWQSPLVAVTRDLHLHCHVHCRACQECKQKSFKKKPTSIFCCHFIYTYGIFSQKRLSKNFWWWEIDLKMGPTH